MIRLATVNMGLRETTVNIDKENKRQGKQVTNVCTKCYIFMDLHRYYSCIHKAFLITSIVTLNTLTTGDADLRFYITTVQDG